MAVSHFAKLGVHQIHFTACLASQEVLNKDPNVWLDGARPPLISVFGPALAWKWVWWSPNLTNLVFTKNYKVILKGERYLPFLSPLQQFV